MKNIVIIASIIVFLINTLLGCILSNYSIYNIILNNGIILVNGVIVLLTCYTNWKDAFKISLFCILPIFTICEIILGCLAPREFYDNWYNIVIGLCIFIEILLFFIVSTISKINKTETK